METTREVKVEETRNVHTFICDKCGKVIGETPECDDGFYGKLGKKIDVRMGSSKLYGLLCDECFEKFEKEVKKVAEEIAKRNGLEIKGFADWCMRH